MGMSPNTPLWWMCEVKKKSLYYSFSPHPLFFLTIPSLRTVNFSAFSSSVTQCGSSHSYFSLSSKLQHWVPHCCFLCSAPSHFWQLPSEKEDLLMEIPPELLTATEDCAIPMASHFNLSQQRGELPLHSPWLKDAKVIHYVTLNILRKCKMTNLLKCLRKLLLQKFLLWK